MNDAILGVSVIVPDLVDRDFVRGLLSSILAVILLTVTVGLGADIWKSIIRRRQIDAAEAKAYTEGPVELEKKLEHLTTSHAGLEGQAEEIKQLIRESREAIQTGALFNLYSKQIELYQQQTRSRASWSFIAAILAMISGLAFVFWGGTVMLSGGETTQLAAGGSIAAIGGAASGFIAKTFLDVHRLSIGQLNRYFQQPVINDHILMAQRLADDIGDADARKNAYETVIVSIAGLIRSSLKDQDLVKEKPHDKNAGKVSALKS